MLRSVANLLLAFILLAATACERVADQTGDGRTAADSNTADSMASGSAMAAGEQHAADDTAAGAHGASGHTGATEGGQALLPIMQRLGSEMTALTYALMTDDYATVTRSAAAIAEHAPISAEEIERIHAELGPDMTVFEAVDESVHVASVRLHEAAEARQLDQVVERLGEVQRGCVSCHAQFRARLQTSAGGR